MEDYELVISRCKRLEGMLEQGFGASGRGLHEKVSSVQARLPQPLIKKLRFIATVRNRLVHEADVHQLDDKSGFDRATKDAERQLTAMLQPARSGRSSKTRLLVALCIAVALASAVLASFMVANKLF